MPANVDVSIVVPAYNESENLRATLERIVETFAERPESWELLFVNDGSIDDTEAVGQRMASEDERVRIVGYPKNSGRGRALRTGFAAARGDIVVSTDADLSYDPAYILDLLDVLRDEPDVDFVLASAYMPGGGSEGVPFMRLLISRLGNQVLRATVNRDIHTFTCVFRAYRREVLDALPLTADGKEIHLEILSRALGAGFRLKEVPAILRSRKMGKSKFRFRGTAITHLLFSATERPALLFGAMGGLLLVFGFLCGLYVTMLRFEGSLNAGRPLITLVVILVLGGMQLLSFGFIAVQITQLRRELFRTQRDIRLLRHNRVEPAKQPDSANVKEDA